MEIIILAAAFIEMKTLLSYELECIAPSSEDSQELKCMNGVD